jgi:hypothetical protein
MTPVPEVIAVEDFPLWAREPAKIVGWLVTGVLLLCSLVTFLLSPDVLEVLPEKWKPYVRTATIAVAAVSLIAQRVQTWLTRNGLGKPGNGKDGVYSPAGAEVLATATAIQVAQAKNVDPGTSAL